MRDQGKPIITSLMDQDKYKITMQQINFHQYSGAMARYRFKCRTQGVDLTPLIPAIRQQVAMIGELSYQESELRYLSKERHLTPDFIDYLSTFRLDPSQVHVGTVNGQLDIYTSGSMLKTSPWELYILPIVNELWYRHTVAEPDYEEGRKRLANKLNVMKDAGPMPGFQFADFGSRRRFSKEWQEEVIRTTNLMVPDYFVGTSNYHFAMEKDITPIGTMAHEYLQTWQALVHPLDAQRAALDAWAQEFRGDLGVALTDVIGMDSFCEVLDLYLAKQFDGFRQDSGDVFEWGEKLITRLNELKVEPATKTGVWSDGLNVPKMIDIYKHFTGRLQTSFGYGTGLTNDLGYDALSIVMKVVEVNGRPVAKLSDSAGKTMSEDPDYVNWLASSYGRREEFAQ